MKIDWKLVAQSPGYKSLKAAYAQDIKKRWRDKEEALKKFNWVINRAKHYAYVNNVTIDVILNDWEAGRSYWWLNYYGSHKQPKLVKKDNVKPPKETTYLLRVYRQEKKHVRSEVAFKQLKNAKTVLTKTYRKNVLGKKPRWDTERKKHQKHIRERRARNKRSL